MLLPVPSWLAGVDRVIVWSLAPLAVIFILSGLDDLAIDIAWLVQRLCGNKSRRLRPRELARITERRVAILVPLWKEHSVIARMLEHSLAALRYSNYHFFTGVYPNDDSTGDAVHGVADRFPNVHLAMCPHDGPTSKADCLNWIYQHVCLFEEETGQHFDLIVTHDAEDMIHPDELRWINAYAERYDLIQVPVLALATPLHAITHGVYCDEFAEYHSRDMVVRGAYGCFIPGSGVGTGYRREALEKLAESESNRVFEPTALTEDYDIGLRLYRLGCRQAFVPLVRTRGSSDRPKPDFMATREYFPQSWGAALRQRTRWVTGIALQSWERFGWRGSPGEVYWLWRDRKGLIGSPLGVVANAIFFYGLATALWTRGTPLDARLSVAALGFQLLRLGVRMGCVARIYGVVFSLGVPIRVFYANLLNAAATFGALYQYLSARLRHLPLRWLKTEHAYPSRATLVAHRRRLGEILVTAGKVTAAALRHALETRPSGVRLGAQLVRLGYLRESELYEVLSLQQGLPLAHLYPDDVERTSMRVLPSAVARNWRLLPFRIAQGSLFVAGPDLPSPEMNAALRVFTALEIRFHLVTPTEYNSLTRTLL
ncbi:MAG TPA: glycosyl transferase family protein [Bryobacteraceae bacterium]|nr:glycosyl transferase family protein [Bryobacteraceae bacterium]